MRPHGFQIVFLVMATVLLSACSQRPEGHTAAPEDITHTVQEHGVTVTLTLSPGTVDPREDALLTIRTRYPSGLHIDFPEPAGALEGFAVAAVLSPPDTRDAAGYRSRETVLRLTPTPGSSYRIAPMLFSITPGTEANGATLYLITPAIRPPVQRTPVAPDTATLTTQPEPLYIPPTPTEITRWVLLAALVLVVLAAMYGIGRKLRRRIKIMMMSPTERARYELERLLAQDLPGKGLFKEFYFAITGIVRTYIERRHGIRAPELTTPEFLETAANRTEFEPAVVERLRLFLESADLVKFAAWTPTQHAIQDTIETAQAYIAEDEPASTEGRN